MATYSRGNHLVTNIDIVGMTEHHGLYIGNGEVIHLSRKGGGVLCTSLSYFSDGNSIRVKRQASNPSEAISRAKEYVGEEGYCLFSNNCEQFVNYCIKGKKSSNQVSNTAHGVAHGAARVGVLGGNVAKVAGSTLGVVTIASTGAKYVGEYIGLPDSVNTVVGSVGDLVAKPLESAVVGVFDTVGSTFDKLSDGEVLDAGAELIGGTINTVIDVVSAPIEVVGDVFSAIGSWFD
ncbi:lecithin retinol acyltransferase family protein [bacterium]|nr:lecithin retinol acyltransferase family protein [bacterium]MBU1956926.1 lecithin retinol acyltransferase family protein [bacterium]